MVAVHNGVNLALHGVFIQWVELNLLVFLSVKSNSDGFGSDVRWEHDVTEDLEVDSSESSRSWSHLGWVMLGSRGDDCSVSNNNNWLLVLGLEVLLDKRSNLLESSVRSVWDSHKEVLSR